MKLYTLTLRALVFLLFGATLVLAQRGTVAYINRARTFTVPHTFNPGGSPFLIGSGASGVEVAGLHAQQMTAWHSNGADCAAGTGMQGIDAAGAAEGTCQTLTSSAGSSVWEFFTSVTLSQTVTQYMGWQSGALNTTGACVNAAGSYTHYAPVAGTAKNLYCKHGTNTPGASKSVAYTLYEMDVGATALTCTISGSSSSCSDTTTSPVTINAGSCYAIQTVPTNTPGVSQPTCTVAFTAS